MKCHRFCGHSGLSLMRRELCRLFDVADGRRGRVRITGDVSSHTLGPTLGSSPTGRVPPRQPWSLRETQLLRWENRTKNTAEGEGEWNMAVPHSLLCSGLLHCTPLCAWGPIQTAKPRPKKHRKLRNVGLNRPQERHLFSAHKSETGDRVPSYWTLAWSTRIR
ncbi:hypothetical protein VULLAG_LOCUS14736 [Vulpes lagopus]